MKVFFRASKIKCVFALAALVRAAACNIVLRFVAIGVIIVLNCGVAAAQGVLGTPGSGKTVSGVGVVSGYHCASDNIDVYIDGNYLGKAGAGTTLLGTQGVCGRTDTGFSLLYNFNNLQPGQHVVSVYADGVLFGANTIYSARSGGVPWLSGKAKQTVISDFPEDGKSAIVEWIESYQNFVVTDIVDTSTLSGTYVLARVSLQDTYGNILDTMQSNVSASGTLILSNGHYSQSLTLVINGTGSTVSSGGYFQDYDYYLYDSTHGRTGIIASRGANFVTSALTYVSGIGYVNELDYWVRTDLSGQ